MSAASQEARSAARIRLRKVAGPVAERRHRHAVAQPEDPQALPNVVPCRCSTTVPAAARRRVPRPSRHCPGPRSSVPPSPQKSPIAYGQSLAHVAEIAAPMTRLAPALAATMASARGREWCRWEKNAENPHAALPSGRAGPPGLALWPKGCAGGLGGWNIGITGLPRASAQLPPKPGGWRAGPEARAERDCLMAIKEVGRGEFDWRSFLTKGRSMATSSGPRVAVPAVAAHGQDIRDVERRSSSRGLSRLGRWPRHRVEKPGPRARRKGLPAEDLVAPGGLADVITRAPRPPVGEDEGCAAAVASARNAR